MYYTDPKVYEFISKQTGDPIVERKTCKVSGIKFAIFQSDLDFYERISPTFNDKKYKMTTPTLCPEERNRTRLMFRNERKLYKRKCDATGETIISIYSPDKNYKVYSPDYWWSDKWDPLEYGIGFEFNKTFSEQMEVLKKNIPILPLFATNNTNSDYTNGSEQNKNCYLIFVSDHNQDCYYSDSISYCEDSFELLSGYNLKNSYQCIGSENCLKSQYLINCTNTNFSKFCFDCSDIENCFMCFNLKNRKYCILNKQYTKEKYEKELVKYDLNHKNSIEILYKKLLDIKNNSIFQANIGRQNELSYGNDIYNCNKSSFLFNAYESENCKYGTHVNKVKFCQDSYVIVDGSELCYGCVSTINNYKCNFTYSCWNNNSNLFYCELCMGCKNCFGCISLRNKEYCIFNKQYTKKEYEKLIPKIIEHMTETKERGEFFNPSLSPFGYNETVANEYFPLSRKEALTRGYKRQDNNYDPVIPEGVQTLKGDDIPSDISTVNDDILKNIFVCEVSGRPFRIIKQELDFYHKHNLPLPRKHPDIRHEERLKQRPPRKLHLRKCDKCDKEILSVYPSDYDAKILCQECYNEEIYG